MKFKNSQLLNVYIDLEFQKKLVGRLAIKDHRIWFEYDDGFLSSGLEISPYKLPLKTGAQNSGDYSFDDGLFGVFNDSLPDGWGRLLIDRELRRKGHTPESLSALDRLALVGDAGMGALSYEPDYSIDQAFGGLDLDKLSEESKQILKGASGEIIEELLKLNGSSGGARPKIVASVSKDKKNIIHGLHNSNNIPKDYEHWLIKFSSSQDAEDIGAIEYAYSLMAKEAGIEIPPTHLYPAKCHPGYFGVKRFDREGSKRFHIHTVSGLLHADHRYPNLDYDNLLRTTLALSKDVSELKKAFSLAVFNVFAHNRDDHSKNVSFIMNSKGKWKLAPAYDLTFSYGLNGEHSMMICGEGKNPGKAELLKLAKNFDIEDANEIINQIQEVISKWKQIAKDTGVSKKSIESIHKEIRKIL